MSFLAGFAPDWHDAAAYLDALRRDLGEARRLDRVPEYLAGDVVSHGGGGLAMSGPAEVAADLAARRAAFPDLSMLPEETLWTATAQNALVAAQRFQMAGRHDGPGLYGAPTGRAVGCIVMTERWCVAGKLREEWILRDEAALLRQIGMDEEEGARWRLATAPAPGGDLPAPGYAGTGNDDAWGHTLGDLLHRVMCGETDVIERHYDPAAELFLPGGDTGCGPGEAQAFWIGLRAAFPSAEFRVEHLLGAEEALGPPRATMRWRLTGRHDGHGALGRPTGAMVDILGMTQAEFGPDGLRREWTLYDRPGVLAQILGQTGA
ncbi:ester cyclase [Salipiger mucosus]|uniref:SnoaL-like domain-containing protein n=1 Tax=Salipiger mucosus DSM 16094 TaxID=1123237 RepID=S9QTJ3_9RHOB|nr:ester cyclase [Salipiger mucosus]EPX82973.1 hypothetical protein Salmuc_04124 [Salipiger mucosus DSM 16094]